MDFWQAMIWIVGGALVFVVIRMLWVSMFRAPETVSPLTPVITRHGSLGGDDSEDRDEAGDTWIEIDIEPLFPSSETSVVDLTEEQEPESRP